MIREKFRKDISVTIDSHKRFESSDFKISAQKEKNSSSTTLEIYYSIEPKYKIRFSIPTSAKVNENINYGRPYYSFSGNVCPGPLSYEESFSFIEEREIFERITNWLNGIWEELSSSPIVKQVENQQKQIDEIYERFDSIEDDYFNIDEANELKRKLDELESSLKKQIETYLKDKTELEQEVNNLHTDIDTLKQTVQSLKRKGWLKSLTGKVFKWTQNSENRKLLQDGYTVIREFLPENIKGSLPDIK